MIVAAQHEGHAHGRIVDRIAEEEGDAAVGAQNDEIADVGRGKALRAVDHVLELNDYAGIDFEPQCRSRPRRNPAPDLVIAQSTTLSRVARRLVRRQLCATLELELLRGAEARIHEPVALERLDGGRVDRGTFTLPVRAWGPPRSGPSSHARPSHARSRSSSPNKASLLRSASVSSTRSTKRPPLARAASSL
jgi:hypothetical protein